MFGEFAALSEAEAARRIADGEVPPAIADVSLHALDIGLLQAGAQDGSTVAWTLVVGSVVAALGTSLTPFLVGRVLQGMAMGYIPVAISMVREIAPPEKRAGAVAAVSATMGVGGAIGLPLAAWLLPIAAVIAPWIFGGEVRRRRRAATGACAASCGRPPSCTRGRAVCRTWRWRWACSTR